MTPKIACPHCGAHYKIPPGMGGKKAKCGACRNYFMFPSADKLESSSAPLLTPEPINEIGPFLDEILLEPPPIPHRSRFSKLKLPWLRLPYSRTSRLRRTRWRRNSTRSAPLFQPSVLYENTAEWSRYLGGYLPRFLLLLLVTLGIFHLLALPTDPRSPNFFVASAFLGGIIACFGFLDDFEGFTNILSIIATILAWAIAMAIAVVPCLMLFLMFIVSQTNGMRLSPDECGMSFIIVTALFFMAIAFTGAFMQYGFFRPAAVFFIGFCLFAPQAQNFYHRPFDIYAKLYSKNPKEVCQETQKGYNAYEPDIFTVPEKSDLETVDQAVEQLHSKSLSAQQQALIELSQITPIDEKRELVCRAIISNLNNEPESEFWGNKTIKVLNDWMSPAISGELIQMVNNSVAEEEYWRINLLAQVPNAPLADIIVNHWQSRPLPLTEAIYSLGPRAEEPLWKYLSSEDRNVLARTCIVLVQVGTKRSIPKLLALVDDPDQFVVRIAKSSVKDLEKKNGDAEDIL